MSEEEAKEYLRTKNPDTNWQDGIVRYINNWTNFVTEIADGTYNGNENEYWDDLDTRLVLNEVGYDNEDRVKTADDIFRKLLIHTDMRTWGYDDNRKDDWWNFGYPKTVNSDLMEEFEMSYKNFLKNK